MSQSDALGRVTTYDYDPLGNLVKITQPDPDDSGPQDAPVTEFEYDKLGNLVTIVDPRGGVTQFVYDARHRRIEIIQADPDGAGSLASPTWEFSFDDAGQLITETDPLGRVTTHHYDALGRRTKTIQPDPDGVPGLLPAPETAFGYDAAGRLTSVTDALGKTTHYAYNALDHQTSILLPDPDGAGSLGRPETVIAYDALGNRLSLTDAVGNVTQWEYDNLNRVIVETNELLDERLFEYDAVNNLIRQTDRLGRVREFSYDELNRRTQELWLDGQTVVNTIDYTFDAAGQLTAASDVFSDYTMTHDLLGRVTQIDVDYGGPLARLMQTFDAAGNRTALSAQLDIGNGWVDDFVNSYTFDALGRPISQDQAGVSGGNPVSEKRVDLAYNAAGQLTTITRYKDLDGGSTNEVATSAYGYDLLGRLTDLTHTHDATFIADYNWTFDALSRVTQMAFTAQVGNDGTSDYDYDHTNQLIDADHDYQTDEDYTFDENGNRTMSGYTTGDNNQLTSDGIWNYSHDAEGNRLWQQRISSNSADDYRIEYTWDHRNRLTRLIYKNNSGAITKQIVYTYDLFNRRIAKEIDLDGAGINAAAIERYLHDGDHIVLVFDGNDALTHRYFNNPNAWDQVFADEQFLNGLTIGDTQASVGDNVWALADNLGSVRDLVDNDGDVINHITYDAFGVITSETAPATTTPSPADSSARTRQPLLRGTRI